MLIHHIDDRSGMIHPGSPTGRKAAMTMRAARRPNPWIGFEELEPRQLLAAQIINPIGDQVTQTGAADTFINLANHFDDDFNQSLQINYRSLGTVEVLLYGSATPLTVANFLGYVNRGDYTDAIIHRSVGNFVIQGGGFRFNGDKTVSGATGAKSLSSPFPSIPTQAPVLNEPFASNIRGAISMAKLGGQPNSANSQFFFNLIDNNNPLNPNSLDNQNGGFSAFGRVIGGGMSIIDQIGSLPAFDFDTPNNTNAFGELPLRSYTSANLAANAPVTGDNVVIIDSITVGEPSIPAIPDAPGQEARLSLSAISSDPQLVEATIEGGYLRLQYSPFLSGVATITIRATDLLVLNPPGTLAPYSNFEEITFQVQVDAQPEDFDDTLSEAFNLGSILPGGSIEVYGPSIDNLSDVDMYCLTVAAGQTVGFDIDRPSGGVDSVLRLFDAAGTQLAVDDDGNNGQAPGESASFESYIQYTFAAAGTYYLGVSCYPNFDYDPIGGSGDTQGHSTGPYTLIVTAISLPGDFNFDAIINADDIDILAQAVAGGQNNPFFDLTGDGVVTRSDIDHLVRGILNTQYGDANLNQQVSIGDLTIVAENFGSPGGWSLGDFNGDGFVGIGDLTLLAENYGFGTGVELTGTDPDSPEAPLWGLQALTPAQAAMKPYEDAANDENDPAADILGEIAESLRA